MKSRFLGPKILRSVWIRTERVRHRYIRLRKNRRRRKLPSADLMPINEYTGQNTGTNLSKEGISVTGYYKVPSTFVGCRAAGLENGLTDLSFLRLFWQQGWCVFKGLIHTSAPVTLKMIKNISFLPLLIRYSMSMMYFVVNYFSVPLQALKEIEKEGK